MVLIRLEISLQCSSKVCPRERAVGRAEQAMMHVPGSLQEKSYLQSPVQGAGAAPRHSYSITETDGPRLGGALGDGGPRSDWTGRVNSFMGLKSRADSH